LNPRCQTKAAFFTHQKAAGKKHKKENTDEITSGENASEKSVLLVCATCEVRQSLPFFPERGNQKDTRVGNVIRNLAGQAMAIALLASQGLYGVQRGKKRS